jgi:hypothetical protein
LFTPDEEVAVPPVAVDVPPVAVEDEPEFEEEEEPEVELQLWPLQEPPPPVLGTLGLGTSQT